MCILVYLYTVISNFENVNVHALLSKILTGHFDKSLQAHFHNW